jgi:xylulokinase
VFKDYKYIIAFDVGTSSNKAVLLDTNGQVHCSSEKSYPFQYPNPGWVEQDPRDYWKAIVETTKKVLSISKINPKNVLGIVYTTQAMGIIPVDKDGNVLRSNITWVDGRAEDQALAFMKKVGGKNIFKSIIGIEITGKDVLPKLVWLRENEPEIYHKMDKVLDVNGFLKFKATGKKVFEWSGASSYTFDLKKKDWTRLLFKIIKFDLEKLPELVRSVDVVGGLTKEAAAELGLVEGTPVFGGCDDTQSAAIGSSAIEDGEAHIYLGSSAWVGVMTDKIHKFRNAAVCLPSADPGKNLVVGITESAGSNIDWLIEKFYSAEKNNPDVKNIFSVLNEEASTVPPGSEYLIFTPWLLGERCPVSSTTTRATIFNLSLEHGRGHLMRALLEGIAYNLRWIIENFENDFGFDLPQIKVIGGGSQNRDWMQIISDVTKRKIISTSQPKLAGAIGAAVCVLVGTECHPDFNCVKQFVKEKEVYIPNSENFKIYDELFLNYQTIYKSLKSTYRKANLTRFN